MLIESFIHAPALSLSLIPESGVCDSDIQTSFSSGYLYAPAAAAAVSRRRFLSPDARGSHTRLLTLFIKYITASLFIIFCCCCSLTPGSTILPYFFISNTFTINYYYYY